MEVSFVQLNHGWNAEPNAPEPRVSVDGARVSLRFVVNAFQFPAFEEGNEATLHFSDVERFRLGQTNDEGWYMGQCRFSKLAPRWGEFYQVSGDQELLLAPSDWHVLSPGGGGEHFLFYLRDGTFECVAQAWTLELPGHRSVNADGQAHPPLPGPAR